MTRKPRNTTHTFACKHCTFKSVSSEHREAYNGWLSHMQRVHPELAPTVQANGTL